MSERTIEGLRQMREHAEIGIRYVREHPNWREDQFAIDAIAKRVELLSEAASHRVPRSEWRSYPSIPWVQIVGMRHRLVHHYDKLDIEVLGDTVDRDLPKLIEEIDQILR